MGGAVDIGDDRGPLAGHRPVRRQGSDGRGGRRRRRLRRGAQGLRRGSVAADDTRRASGGDRQCGQTDRGPRRPVQVPAQGRDRPTADDRRHDAVRGCHLGPAVLLDRRGQVHLVGHPRRDLRADPGAARAYRGRRCGGGLERSAVPGLQQAWPGTARGVHHGAQARRRDPAERQRARRGVRRGRPARGRALGGARWGRDRTRTDRQSPGGQVHLHRQFRGRQRGRQAGRREAQALHAGTGRQVGGDHPRRRRRRLHPAAAAVRRFDELRAGVRSADPDPGTAVTLRRDRHQARCRGGRDAGGSAR